MALPQSIDPTTLNISGKPALSNVAPTSITSTGGTGMPMPRIGMEKNTVSPLLGSLFGGLLGYAYGEKNAGATAVNKPTGQAPSGNAPSGNAPSGNLPTGGTPTGNIGSVNSIKFPAGTTQAEIDLQYGTTNGQSNYVVSGVNMSNGEVVALPNDKIGGTNLGTNTGNFGFEADTGTTTGGLPTTPTDTTQIANQYFQDSQGNIYDASGTLIYVNPSTKIPGATMDGGGYDPNASDTISGGGSSQYLQDSQGNLYDENGTLIYYNPSNAIPGTNDGGGGYDPNVSDTEQYYEDSSGNIFDYSGNLVLEYGNGYYYEPDTGNFYDSNFDSVGNDFNAYQDFFNIPTYGGSDNYNYDFGDLGDYFDYENYTPGSTTYIKDGGSVRGGLATPLFRNGGSVPRFDNGGFIDQVVANQMPQSVGTTSTPVATQTNLTNPATTNTTSTTGSILDSILGFAKNNPTVTGAGLGAILTALINSQTEQPVNKGVDMTALGTLKPRTTPTGSARFVPYSEYGTPTTPFDYSRLYSNLGVSPFSAGTEARSPSATPTAPVSALSTLSTPRSASRPFYSYGTLVDPSRILSARSTPAPRRFAEGGMSDLEVTSLSDALEPPTYAMDDYTGLSKSYEIDARGFPKFDPNFGIQFDEETMMATDTKGNKMSAHDFVNLYGDSPSNPTYAEPNYAVEEVRRALKPEMFTFSSAPTEFDMASTAMETTSAPTEELRSELAYPIRYGTPNDDVRDYPTRDDSFRSTSYESGPLYASSPISEGGYMMSPSYMSDMGLSGSTYLPTVFGTYSPTFRYSGLNNPLLTGLSMTPRQPYTLAEGGSPHGNPNVPNIQGRQDYRQGAYVQGAGDGQSDDIPAMLADGEYVIDAETVAQLGNGSNKAGAKMLDTFRENIRAHKRSAPTNKIPPKSKSALAYLKGAK